MRNSLLALAEALQKASRAPRVKKSAIEVTDAAAERVRELLQKRAKVSPP